LECVANNLKSPIMWWQRISVTVKFSEMYHSNEYLDNDLGIACLDSVQGRLKRLKIL
jgi:hypothetical protein